MNTQYRKNLKAVLEASKTYADNKIEDLKWELGTYDLSVDTIDGTTMLLPTPANTIQSTMVRVEGKSEKCSNLCPTATYNDIMNNTIDKSIDLGNLPNGTYTISFNVLANADNRTFILYYYNNGVWDGVNNINTSLNGTGAKSYTFTLDSSIPYDSIRFSINTTSLNYSIQLENLMLNTGSTALPYEPYYTGIHSFEWTGVKVEGSNLINLDDKIRNSSAEDLGNNTTINGVLCNLDTENNTITLSGKTTVDYWTIYLYLANPITLKAGNSYSFDKFGSGVTVYFNSTTPTSNLINLAEDLTITRIRLYVNNINTAINTTIKPMLIKGSTAPTSFEPYISQNITIDLSTILYNGSPLFEGNSLKAVNTIKDSVTPYKATKKLGYIDLGSLNWTYDDRYTYSRFFSETISNLVSQTTGTPNVKIDNNYTLVASNGLGNIDKAYTTYNARVYIEDSSYTSASSFKTAMSGVYLVYELTTPIEVSIDWSDKLIKQTCYSNGSTTLLNTNNQDTTSTFKYLKEVAK